MSKLFHFFYTSWVHDRIRITQILMIGKFNLKCVSYLPTEFVQINFVYAQKYGSRQLLHTIHYFIFLLLLAAIGMLMMATSFYEPLTYHTNIHCSSSKFGVFILESAQVIHSLARTNYKLYNIKLFTQLGYD